MARAAHMGNVPWKRETGPGQTDTITWAKIHHNHNINRNEITNIPPLFIWGWLIGGSHAKVRRVTAWGSSEPPQHSPSGPASLIESNLRWKVKHTKLYRTGQQTRETEKKTHTCYVEGVEVLVMVMMVLLNQNWVVSQYGPPRFVSFRVVCPLSYMDRLCVDSHFF